LVADSNHPIGPDEEPPELSCSCFFVVRLRAEARVRAVLFPRDVVLDLPRELELDLRLAPPLRPPRDPEPLRLLEVVRRLPPREEVLLALLRPVDLRVVRPVDLRVLLLFEVRVLLLPLLALLLRPVERPRLLAVDFLRVELLALLRAPVLLRPVDELLRVVDLRPLLALFRPPLLLPPREDFVVAMRCSSCLPHAFPL